MSAEGQCVADRNVAVLAHARGNGINGAPVASGDTETIREQTGQIVKQALIDMGAKASLEQMASLVEGFVGLACLATAEYRRARALHGPGPEAVDRLYQKNGARGHHEQQ